MTIAHYLKLAEKEKRKWNTIFLLDISGWKFWITSQDVPF